MTSSTKNDLDLSQLQDQISRLAKDLKSEKDLGDLTQQLVKMSVEAALGAELEEHLGYVKHDPAGRGSGACKVDCVNPAMTVSTVHDPDLS